MTNVNAQRDPPRKCGGSSCKQSGGSEYSTRLHVPILYGLIIVLSAACSVSFWVCFTQLSALRRDFEGEILPGGMADFGPASLHRYDGYSDSSSEDDDDEEDEENVTSLGIAPLRSPPDRDATHTTSDREKRHAHTGYEVLGDVQQSDVDEDLIRVKRRSHKKRSRKRNTKEKDRRPPAFFYEGGEGSRDDPNNGGSGSATDHHVWLTSYSRIPVFALQEFCAATRDYCPPGQPGPQGIPGKIGLKGEHGEIGLPGVTGADGIPGTKGQAGERGDTGDIGQPGLNGTDGLIGIPGEKGERGEAGERGSKGDMGHPGLSGSAGDKGEAGEAGIPGFNGTEGAQGPPGPPGLPGPEGPEGPRGLEGPIGPEGVHGEPGINGTDGEKGKRGKRGQDGEPGQPGEPGARGPKGDTGDPGSDVNCTCPPGPYAPGPPGPSGPMGPNGHKGQKGEPGRSNMLLDTTIATTTTTTPVPTTPPITTPEPTIDPRTASCGIRMVGKPLFQRYTGTYWGAWMKDTFRDTAPDVHKFWFTRHFTGKSLYEYANQDEFRANRESHVYSLEDLYFGTGHVVYDGHFYYHKSGTRDLIKYDLAEETAVGTLHVPDAAFQGKHYVYSTEYNYFDLATDANGLWAIYNQEGEGKHLLVSKVNTDNMTIEKTWNITLNHRGYGNGFVTCGVLYLIRNTNAKTTLIDFAYDMYTKTQLRNVRLQFTNPFQMNNMISYNHLERKIYSWDKGNQLTYPLLLKY